MKLYNLYKEVILEGINEFDLKKAISNNVEGFFLNGDPDKRVHYMVEIEYKDRNDEITNRWICIGHIVITKTNEEAISAYVVTGNKIKEIPEPVNQSGIEVNQITTTDPADWRIFLIKNILNFKESKVRVYSAPIKYKENGWISNKGPVARRIAAAKFDFKKGNTPFQQQNKTVNNQNNELNK